jgi:cytochrome d ubiquinol oxidase subunit II
MRVDPVTLDVATDFIEAWWAPFPFAVGVFVLTLFAWLAGVYMTLEVRPSDSDSESLRDDFRQRALGAGLASGAASLLVLVVAPPHISGRLLEPAFLVRQGVGASLGVAALWCLFRRRFPLARVLAIVQVTVVILGLGLAQWPHFIAPGVTFERALAPQSVVVPMLIVLAIGAPPLLLALAWLYRVFKR